MSRICLDNMNVISTYFLVLYESVAIQISLKKMLNEINFL
jgi:hypothetical protein